MIGMLLTGHGNFATGLASSVKLIAGMPEKFELVDFVEEYSVEDLRRELNAALDRLSDCSAVLVFSDLPGGSPFKTSVEISVERDQDIRVLAGTNLGMLIEISMARGFIESADDLLNMAINTGKDQVMAYVMQRREETECEDGI